MNSEIPPIKPARSRVELPIQVENQRLQLAFRGVVLIIIVAALGSTWYCFVNLLLPAQKQVRTAAATAEQLSAQIDALQQRWPDARVRAVRIEYRQVPSRIFSDEAALRKWLATLDQEALKSFINLKVTFGVGKPSGPAGAKMIVIPMTMDVELKPVSGTDESSYQRLLRWSRRIASDARRADLIEASLDGGNQSVTSARFLVNLWTAEEESK